MYESMGPSKSRGEGGYYEGSNEYQSSGGLGEYGGSGRLGYGGVQSWTESTGYYRKRRQAGRQTPYAKRDVFAKRFSCPASSDPDPISEGSDVAAASEAVERK